MNGDAPGQGPTPAAAATGQLLAGRFELLEELGTGSSGTVYRAVTTRPFRDLAAGTPVAVKFIRSDLLDDAGVRRQLAREGELGLRVRSPNVVRILGVETLTVLGVEVSYLVMELVDGRSVRDVLRDGGPVLNELARRIGEDVARGLAALHALDVVHRDVKPENLVLTSDGRVTLMDLGLARTASDPRATDESPLSGGRRRGETESSRSSHGFFGSLAYAAPELLAAGGGAAASPASDLFALGVVLFEVLTGKHPFAPDGEHDLDARLLAQLHDDPPRPSHLQPRISDFLDAIVLSLLKKSPSARWQHADASHLARTLAEGEASDWWRDQVRREPVLASRRRLAAIRRSRHTRFFGRARERARLDRDLRRALRGGPHTVLVTGPRGSGRRRLLDECIDRWLDERPGLTFLGGVADGRPTTPQGAPFQDLVRDWWLRGDSVASPNAEQRLVERCRSDAGMTEVDAERLASLAFGDRNEISTEERTELLFRALVHVLRHCASGGAVLRIDHVEVASAPARAVLDRLIALDERLPLLVLLVSDRPITLGPTADGDPVDLLRVAGLDRASFNAFGRALFAPGLPPTAPVPDAAIDAAHGTLAGNPQSLMESLEDLAAAGGILDGRPGAYRPLRPIGELNVPRPLLLRLRTRLASLPAAQRFVLQAAAVLGQGFELGDLVDLTGRPELEVLEALGAFDNRIVRTEASRGRFRHRDLRTAIVASAAPDVRRRLHRAAAWLLDDRGARRLEIGMHLSRALEHDACIAPLVDGLAELVRSGSRRAATRVIERLRVHFARAEDAARHASDRIAFHELAARTLRAAGRPDRARTELEAATRAAAARGDVAAKIRVRTALADLEQHAGRMLTALQLLATAERLGDEAGAAGADDEIDDALARSLGLHGRVLAFLGQAKPALDCGHRALDRAPPSHRPLRANLLIDIARWRALRSRFEAAERSFERAEHLVERMAAKTERAVARTRLRLLAHRGRTRAWLGLGDDARLELERAVELATELGEARLQGRCTLFLAEQTFWVHDDEQAADARLRGLLAQVRALADAAGDRVTRALGDAMLATLDGADIERDDLDEQVPLVALARGLARASLAEPGAHADCLSQLQPTLRLARDVDAPLPMRLALLRLAGFDDYARRLVRRVAAQLRDSRRRERFTAFASRIEVPNR